MNAKKAAAPSGRPPGSSEKPSKGLAAIDALLAAGQRHEANVRRKEQATELQRIQNAMHRIEAASGGESVADILEGMVADTPLASLNPRSSLTADQIQVLERVGSFVEQMPPRSQRATAMTRMRGAELFNQSLFTSEVAGLLGVSESRVRQRVADRTLYSLRSKSGTRFPRFQFTDVGELPGWDSIAAFIPIDAHPLAVQNVVLGVSDDLEFEGELVSPYDWLAAGGDAERVVEVVRAAFELDA